MSSPSAPTKEKKEQKDESSFFDNDDSSTSTSTTSTKWNVIDTQSQAPLKLRDPDDFQSPYRLPYEPKHLYCWTTYFNAYLNCQSLTSNIKSFYRTGTYSDCKIFYENFKTCGKLLKLNAEEAKQQLTLIHQSRDDPSRNILIKTSTPPKPFYDPNTPDADIGGANNADKKMQ